MGDSTFVVGASPARRSPSDYVPGGRICCMRPAFRPTLDKVQISRWLVDAFDDTVVRWRAQVMGVVPSGRLTERFPNGNSILWATYHVARHADLALRVLGADRTAAAARLAAIPVPAATGGSGLQEVQQPWFDEVSAALVEPYAEAVFADAREHLARTSDGDLDRYPDVHAALLRAEVDAREFGWLSAQWSAGGAALLVRWPLTAHITHHVGEMIAIRNQMGLSPFR